MRTHREALSAGQVTAFASAPSGTASAVSADIDDEEVCWFLDGATTVKLWYYNGSTWYAGKTTTSTDGEVLVQAARGEYVQVEIVSGTLTAGHYEKHRSRGAR